MPPHLLEGLSAEAASQICMNQCKAMCCRGSLVLQLTITEVAPFRERAAALGLAALIAPTSDGGGWVRFAEHPGEHCPMLDGTTSACRIYEHRPQRCRDFPQDVTPGCAISGG
jgi:Fe-S-cluster containining protein